MEKVGNQQGKPLISFVYGWGRLFRLYHEYLDIHGLAYPVADLMYVYSTSQRIMNIPSARLTLRFREHDVVLRGISDVQAAQKAVIYLNTLCGESVAPIWKADKSPWSDPLREPSQTLPPQPREYSPITNYEIGLKNMAQAPTTPVAIASMPSVHHIDTTWQQPHLQSVHTLRSYGFNVAQLARQLRNPTLPEHPVPFRLQVGERAHYVTPATRRTPVMSIENNRILPIPSTRDQGMLIFSNLRAIYIGRIDQLILDYTQLTQIFRLPDAIAFVAAHWTQRETFEIQHPVECVMYLEAILQRFQHPISIQQDEYATEHMASLQNDNEWAQQSIHGEIEAIETQPLSQALSASLRKELLATQKH